MKFTLAAMAVLMMMLGMNSTAHADYFVWADPQSGVSFSFPDSWQLVSSAEPDDVVTVMAPSGRARAACRVRVNDDRRYMMYPGYLGDAVQKVAYSRSFWEEYLGAFSEGTLHEVHDDAGLGRSHASYAILGYKGAVPGPYMSRKALAFASLYHGKAYILECSAHRDAFADYKNIFMSIAGSVDFDKVDSEWPAGNYRNFMADPHVMIPDMKYSNFSKY